MDEEIQSKLSFLVALLKSVFIKTLMYDPQTEEEAALIFKTK